MQSEILSVGVYNLHPKKVSGLFEVHLRTVFRWVSRGLLSSRNGFLNNEEVGSSLTLWNSSCSKGEALKKLSVTSNTLRDWSTRGVIKTVQVLGTERVLTSSIEKVLEQKKNGTFSVYPGFVPVYKLLVFLGIRYDLLLGFVKKKQIASEILDGRIMIPIEEYESIQKRIESSMKPSDVGRILKKDRGTIRRWIKKGRLKEVNIFGLRRIETESIASTESERLQLQFRIALISRKKMVKASFRVRRIPELGRLKVVSCRQASKIVGKSEDYIEELFYKGILRGERIDEKIFIAASSLEVFVLKQKKQKK